MILKLGSRGEDVEILQHLLGNRGYLNGAADGIFGPETERAVKAFQRDNGLKDDGVVGPATNAALAKDPSGHTKYLLRKGDKGESVRQLQQALIDAGYSVGSSGVDGDFGQGTYNAVVKFQGDHNLDKDGIVGPATWNALANAKNEGSYAGILKLGSRGEDVEILQHLLGNRGYLNGAADGIFGPETERAVKAFQRDNGLDDDGVVGPATNEALAKDPSGHTEYLLKKGSRGESVRQLQQALINAGYNVGTYGVDGVFGDGTYNAVVKFQGDHNLDADGIVGPKTWKALKGAKHSGNFSGLLRLGNRGENVVDLQELLIKAGYSVGSSGADGIFGQGTYNAVIRFQGDHNLDKDGIVGPATWGALRGGSSSGYSGGLLRLGSRGGDVEELQRLLIKAGYSVGSAGADGIFGQGTYNAVIRFQGDHNLDKDGIVGPATWGALGGKDNSIGVINGDGIRAFLDIARSQIGYHEGANNNSKYGAWYGDNNQPWCAMFVSWCANKAGIMGSLIPSYEGCFAGAQWYRERGRFKLSGMYTPKSGDVFFLSNYTHTGIVESVQGNTVVTIEGNDSNDSVGRHYRSISSIWGFGANGGDISSIPSNEAIYGQQAYIGFAPLLGINEIDVSKSINRIINTGALNISLEYSFKIEKAFENKNDNGVINRKVSIEDLREGNIVFSDNVNEVTIDFMKKSISSIGFLLNKFGNNEVKIIFNKYPTPTHLDISLEFSTKYAGNVSAIQTLHIIITKVPILDEGKVEVSDLVKNAPKYIVCIVVILIAGIATEGTAIPAVLKFLGAAV